MVKGVNMAVAVASFHMHPSFAVAVAAVAAGIATERDRGTTDVAEHRLR